MPLLLFNIPEAEPSDEWWLLLPTTFAIFSGAVRSFAKVGENVLLKLFVVDVGVHVLCWLIPEFTFKGAIADWDELGRLY